MYLLPPIASQRQTRQSRPLKMMDVRRIQANKRVVKENKLLSLEKYNIDETRFY